MISITIFSNLMSLGMDRILQKGRKANTLGFIMEEQNICDKDNSGMRQNTQ